MKYNKFFGRKKCCKLSLITDINGIPFNIGIYGGNIHDSTILLDQLKSENIVNVNSIDCKGIIGDKYFLADSGYDTIEIKKNISKLGMTYLIPQNRRKTKDPCKIKKFTKREPHF